MASRKGTRGEELDHVDAFGNSVTSRDRARKAMATRVKRARGEEEQRRIQRAVAQGDLSLQDMAKMEEAQARAIYADMGE